ncbi:MAG: AraC family transcriptional regulator [Mobilitalea sp.]
MQEILLNQLKTITAEEQTILDGNKGIEKDIYTAGKEFVVDSTKMLDKGKLMDIRIHTRFIHFPKHRHNYIEIIYMCSGQTTHIINDSSEVVLKAGDILFLNQNAYQEIKPAGIDDIAINFIVLPEFFDLAFTMVEGENILRNFIIGTLTKDSDRMDYIHFKVADVLPVQNLMENLVWSLMNQQQNNRQMNQITMGLLFLQLVNYSGRIDKNNPKQYEQNLTMTVLRYIEENYKAATLTEIAAQLNQSVYQLSRLIKEQAGHTFKDLLQTKRLSLAVYLLTTTALSVEDIIAAVGYENTSYFHRLFKGKFGITPKVYREQHKVI